MLLQQYNEAGLLFNSNFLDATSKAGLNAYRGELVLVEGEVGDAKGHSKPPVDILRGTVLLADETLKLVIGAIDKLDSFVTFAEKYQGDFSAEMKGVFFVVNIAKPFQAEVGGVLFTFIPLLQGVPWNEVIDELRLEKSDLKGQSAADKVNTIYSELGRYKPSYPVMSIEEALEQTTDAVREGFGAV
jgi:hypothetical protein